MAEVNSSECFICDVRGCSSFRITNWGFARLKKCLVNRDGLSERQLSQNIEAPYIGCSILVKIPGKLK